ncbi:molecular chaperone Hsp33 [Luteimonas cucumeris]|uniref:Molecular chaperone Hsp33 n=1 Tax=Luteimonas cucumeris TaxID=985012 RepID=A0A562LFE1_9GAMM|nr:Hsp33 family molecular chaperone HslO [Luteimonas cucumeris]TWI06330.1 molecular chaperone Hsp33 [Luteimonas cucumeris]
MTLSPTPTSSIRDEQDRLTRFLLPHAGVRGVHVHLRQTWQQIRERAEYPQAIAELLGQAAVASALFTGHAKIEGRLSVQLRGEGPLRTLFAECTAAGTLRGIAQMGENSQSLRDLRSLGDAAVLAITIENPSPHGRDPTRYQGLVPIESESLAGAFEDYFRQSEQLPTRLLLAADGEQAAGLMLQKLPSDEGDDDGWVRACALFDTLGSQELLSVAGPSLLNRLFHEEAGQLLAERPLSFACSCSRERVAAVLESLGPEEARAALQEGFAEIRCEFCGQEYRFNPDEIEELFASAHLHAASPDRLQ